jgi:hypothetical protein
MLAEFAQLHLLCEAWSRLDTLPELLQDTVKRRVGIAVDTDTVRREGERVPDRWHVLGSKDRQLDKLTERRIWLRGQETGRKAVLMAFGAMQAAPALAMPVGAVYEAEFAFHKEVLPLRAQADPPETMATSGEPPVGGTLRDAANEYGAALATDPWTIGWPVVVRDALPYMKNGIGELADAEGGSVPLSCESTALWKLLAVSGGHPVTVFGEYTDTGLEPLSAWSDGSVVAL